MTGKTLTPEERLLTDIFAAKPVDLRKRPLTAEGLVKAKADLRKHFGK